LEDAGERILRDDEEAHPVDGTRRDPSGETPVRPGPTRKLSLPHSLPPD
jgi:hypothetical protein